MLRSIKLHNETSAIRPPAQEEYLTLTYQPLVTFGTLYSTTKEGADSATRTSRILGADWIPLIRGIRPVLSPVYERIKYGPLSPLLRTYNWEQVDPDALPDATNAELLRVKEIWQDDKNAGVYDEALYLLRKLYAWGELFRTGRELENTGGQETSGVFIWIAIFPEQYFQLLQQRQPQALVIFAFFGAEMHKLDRLWWMEGGGKSIVSVVDECLGPFWRPWLEFPRKVVGLG